MDDREEELREFMDHALDGIISSGAKIISSLQQVSHPQHRQDELGVIAGIQQMFTYVDRAQEDFDASRWLEARQANRLASARLQAVEQSLEFKNLIESSPISLSQNVRPIYDVEELADDFDSIASFQDMFEGGLSRHIHEIAVSEIREDIAQLERAVPDQAPSALEFEVIDDVLHVAHVMPAPLKGVGGIVEQLKTAQLATGERLLAVLKAAGNVDPRVSRILTLVQEQLGAGENIVWLGMLHIEAEVLLVNYSEELPSAVLPTLAGYIQGIAMYLAQFEEWLALQQNFFAANMAAQNPNSLKQTTEALVERLRDAHNQVAPDVPDTLEALAKIAGSAPPGQSQTKAQFTLVRSIGNLCACAARDLWKAGLDILADSARGTAVLVVKAALVMGLLKIVGPEWASALFAAQWMKDALEAAKRIHDAAGE